MPLVTIYGVPVRVRAMLDAIATQESLEDLAEPEYLSPSRRKEWDRERLGRARRRNAAERALRPEEHAAWEAYRRARKAEREAVKAILTDLP